jgi:hypothetical protein
MSIDCGCHDRGPIAVRRDPDNGCSDLDALVGICVPVAFDYKWRPTGAHADDELVIETAINGQADALATFHLKHMRDAGLRFGFRAQRPGPLVRSLRS